MGREGGGANTPKATPQGLYISSQFTRPILLFDYLTKFTWGFWVLLRFVKLRGL